MKKRLALLTFSTVLIGSIFLGGCGSTKTSTTPTASAPAPEKVFELKFNDWGPPGLGLGKVEQDGLRRIEQKSNGRIKITEYFSGTLIKVNDTYKGVASGIADLSIYVVGVTPGVQDLNYIFNIPAIGLPNNLKTTAIYRELLEKFPEIQQENEKSGTRWVSIAGMPPNNLHTTKKQVKVPKDLKGTTMLANGAQMGALMTSNGGTALSLGPMDWYTSLQKGLGEGIFSHYPAMDGFKLMELAKYHTEVGEGGLGSTGFGYIVNLKTWNSLPPDLQQIIVEGFDWINDEAMKMNIALIEKAKSEGKAAGQIFYQSTPEEINLWEQAIKPVNDKWVKETEAKGLPAQKVYDGLLQLIKDNK